MSLPLLPYRLRRLLSPLILSLATGVSLYYGGQAYQVIGLDALSNVQWIITRILSFFEIIFLITFIHRIVQYVVLDGVVASALGTPAPRLLGQLSGIILMLAGFAAVVGIVFKQDLTVLWAASGMIGFVFGFALRDMILDIFTGLAINLDRPVKIGDNIRLHKAGDKEIEGKILEISWRTTRIIDLFNNVVILPNSRLASSTITNYSAPYEFLRVQIIVTLDPDVAPARAIRILEAAAVEGATGFTDATAPPPVIWLREITLHGVEYIVNIFPSLDMRPWSQSAVIAQILAHLGSAGIRPSRVKQEAYQQQGVFPSHQINHYPSAAHLTLLLRNAPLFGTLPHNELQRLGAEAVLREFSPGAVLAQTGETTTAMMLVIEGLTVEDHGRAESAIGKNLFEGPGALIGLESLVLGVAQKFTVRSHTATLVAEWKLSALHHVLVERPSFATDLSLYLARQVLEAEAVEGEKRKVRLSEQELSADVLRALRKNFSDLKL
ncbi:Small-conductance mechanosensitive channel [Azospirillaceae bacterium]